ncbi:MAG: class I adenylate-forming enzyme family protein [Woeseiaceae bacterium]
MQLDSLKETIEQIATTEEIFALEMRDIRGVSYKTFKNGPKNLSDLLEYCLHHGDADFLVYEDERYSFTDVYRNTRVLAKALVDDYGVKPGDRVALLMRNAPEYPIIFMALATVGAVPVLVNSFWTPEELEYGFEDCDAKLAFVDQPRADKMEVFADRLGINRVVVRTAAMEKVGNFWDLIDQSLVDQDWDANLPTIDIDPDDDCAVMYTSGSSGHPKGVVLTHRSAVSAIQSWLFGVRVAELLGYAPSPTIDADGNPFQPCTMMTTPFFHISATHAGFLLSLWIGMKMVILHKWDPTHAVELIEREKVSRFACVPTMSAELLEAAALMGKALESLRTIDSGGAKRPAAQVREIAERMPHALPGTGFGMTETGGPGIGMRGEVYLDNPDAAGRLQPPLLEMKIVDDDDNEVPIGEVGELVLKSVTNMRCYLNQDEETTKALRDGWVYTGDLAKVDENEIITIVDRKKAMIIRGGENISCNEVENALHHHPAVAEVAVFSIPDERLGENVGSCVYLRPGAQVSADDLKEFLSEHIAAYMVPKNIWFRDAALPRGATEKIDRRAIRAEYVS